jgi:hypothetical protein
MKKVLCTTVAALLITGMISAIAGECPCCEKKKAEKSTETTAQQAADASEASA